MVIFGHYTPIKRIFWDFRFRVILKRIWISRVNIFLYWLSQNILKGYSTWWGVSAQKPRLVWLSRTSRNSSCNKKIVQLRCADPTVFSSKPHPYNNNLFIKGASFLVKFLELRFLEFPDSTIITIIYANLFINSHTPPL